MFSSSRRRGAFTLVELMVVVVIIAMLIMLVMPQLHNARNRARSTKCQNNLRQFGVAVNQYISDWSGYFILPASALGGGGTVKQGLGGQGTAEVDGNPSFALSSRYRGGAYVGSETALGASAYHSLSYFIPAYISTNLQTFIETNYVADANGQMVPTVVSTNYRTESVAFCPELDRDRIFNTQSAYFKGLCEYSVADGSTSIILEDNWGKMTTYGINMTRDPAQGNQYVAYNRQRRDIPDQTISFCDWNASEGWMGTAAITYTTSCWYMIKSSTSNAVRNKFYVKCSEGLPAPSKEVPGFLTEVGYRHHIGKDWYANYVAFDGHVGALALPEAVRDTVRNSTNPRLTETDIREGHIGLVLQNQYAGRAPTTYISNSVISNFYLLFHGTTNMP